MTARVGLRCCFLLFFCTGTAACGGAPEAPQTGAAAPAPAGSAPAPRLFQVAADRPWQDTGIVVAPQQKFQLRYRSGEIADKDVKIFDGHGSDSICGDPGCCEPLPDERRASLIGRIAGEIFPVGNGGEYSSPTGGTLFLQVNDCNDGLSDNSGALSVEFIP